VGPRASLADIEKGKLFSLPGPELLPLISPSRSLYPYRLREKRNAHRILVGNAEGKRPLGRRRLKCVDNIKMDFREMGWGGVDWIDLAQDRHQGEGSSEHG
jgi:hypothetical protein